MGGIRVALLALSWIALLRCAVPTFADPLTVQWLPGESYAGGKQCDARLDRPVKLWGAGMPVSKVFAEITAQTGVKLTCLPADDDNARICSNVYLNPKSPPDLRAVMTQLSWVLDCAFGYAGEGEERVYYLLSTSMKAGAVARLTQAQKDRAAKAAQARRGRWAREQERMPARWEEFKAALALSRSELLRRYRGKDDMLLLALAEPGRRALVEYLAKLPPDEMERAFRERHVVTEWDKLTPRQQEELRALFAKNLISNREADPAEAELMAAYQWGDTASIKVAISAVSGFLAITAYDESERKLEERPGRVIGGARLSLVAQEDPDFAAQESLALRRALGEEVTPEGREALLAAKRKEMETRAVRQEAEQMKGLLQARVQLSEAAREALSAVALPVGESEGVALWQLQEAVAAASGWHVISDCFLQPERSVEAALEAFCPEGEEVNTLKALCLLSAAPSDEGPLLHRMGPRYYENEPPELTSPGVAVGWEVGDAGQFLRFRSAERDFWRLSFLPADLLSQVDRWIAPLQQQECAQPCRGRTLEVVMPLPDAARVAARLNEYQGRLGGLIAYADPRDPKEACRQAIRAEVLDELARGNQIGLGAMATLSDDQWERIRGRGIALAELPPRPESDAMRRNLLQQIAPEDLRKVTLRITSEEQAWPGGSKNAYLVHAYQGEKGVFHGLLLRNLQVQVRPGRSPEATGGEGRAEEAAAGPSTK